MGKGAEVEENIENEAEQAVDLCACQKIIR
jgi:hypothetical protein